MTSPSADMEQAIINKESHNIGRAGKGAPYYYISILYWKVCLTTDQYLPSDDERMVRGNYFRDGEMANKCFQAITSIYEKPLKDLREEKKKENKAYEEYCIERLDAAAKLNAEQSVSVERKVSFIDGIVKKHKAHEKAVSSINMKRESIYRKIARMIARWQRFSE